MNDDPSLPPQYHPPAYNPVPAPSPVKLPRRNGLKIYAFLVTLLLVVCIAVIGLWFVADLMGVFDRSSLMKAARKRPYQEAVIGGEESSSNKIVVIYLQGIISYEPMVDMFGRAASMEAEGMVGEIKAQLKQAVEDPDVKAILIRMDTPGGEVTASDDLYNEVKKASTEKPVIVSMSSLAASGGYYIAAAADHIMASETTLTGSVGVIISTLTFEETLKKIGIKPIVFKSGKFKDILSPMREPTVEEAQLIQELVMLDYDRFLEVVAAGRLKATKSIDIASLKTELRNGLADGRILTGKQALDGKLVDSLGYFDDAQAKAKVLASITDAQLVQYYRQVSLSDLLGLGVTSSTQQKNIKVELSLIGGAKARLEPGKRYYLHEGYALP